MIEYVKREDAIEAVDKEYATHDIAQAEENIRELPSADVRENRRGEWVGINPFVDTLECSECGYNSLKELITPFCPWCGAEMEGCQDE